MFDGYNFIFNDIPSELYDFKVVQLNGGVRDDNFGVPYQIHDEKVRQNPVPYFYGAEQAPTLSFTMTIGREHYMDGYTRRAVDRWLSQPEYKILKIQQEDLSDIEFNCMLLDKTNKQFGNLSYAVEYTVKCDAPYGYTENFTTSYAITSDPEDIEFNNPSNVNGYTYPIIFAKLTGTDTGFTITNTTDNSRAFVTGLTVSEEITIDCQRGIITSSTSLNRISDANKNWFRLVNGLNEITIEGLQTFRITDKYPLAV